MSTRRAILASRRAAMKHVTGEFAMSPATAAGIALEEAGGNVGKAREVLSLAVGYLDSIAIEESSDVDLVDRRTA